MDAKDYLMVLLEQQEQKVADLKAEVEELRTRLLMTTGASRDAEKDLVRLQAHQHALEHGYQIPALVEE